MKQRHARGRAAVARRQPSAEFAATPPDRAQRSSSPVGLYRNSAESYALMSALTNLADPDLVLQRAGIARYQLRELEYDDEISAALDTRRDAAVSVPWRLDPGDSPAATFVAEQLEAHAGPMLSGMWSAVPYGYSVLEAVYQELPGGRVGLSDLSERPIEWFKLRRDGALLVTLPGGFEVEGDTAFKWFVTRRNATWRNPYGEALLSRLYWPWHFRRNAWRYWLEFLERFGTPIVLGKANNPKALADALVQMGVSMAIAVGQGEEVEAVTQGAAGEFERAEAALARRVQKVILGQTLTSDVGSSGSYAAAKVHNQVREDRRNADLRMLCGSAQRVVDALWALNRFPGKPPRFAMSDGAGLQLDRSERDAKLVQAGAVQLTEAYLLRAYDYEPGDLTVPTAGTAPQPQQAAPRGRAALTLAAPRFTARQERMEALADAAPTDLQPIDPALIRRAVLAATSEEDLIDRLAALMPQASGRAFDEALARAFMAADVLGYVQEREGAAADL